LTEAVHYRGLFCSRQHLKAKIMTFATLLPA
jgi:hypothetical protein